MLKAIVLVLGLSAAGNAISDSLALQVPGAVIGLCCLFALFCARGGPDRHAAQLFDAVSPVVPMLFVPAAVGVFANPDTVSSALVYMVAAITAGTALTVAVTGLVAQCLMRAVGRIRPE